MIRLENYVFDVSFIFINVVNLLSTTAFRLINIILHTMFVENHTVSYSVSSHFFMLLSFACFEHLVKCN